ncbi:MAG: formyltetrahydrofolate deformylase [Microcoleus vaginatus WJT46-NPBG5]|nr:formyltetrahydrofolate deformylase [Microcoleus vaginatus WJT46-NPBG5]
MTSPTATLLVSCPDQRGLVAKLANFIYAHHGNIIHADHHTDFTAGLFLSRLEWQIDGFDLPRDEIASAFAEIAEPLQASWQLHFSDTVPRIAIWVSRQDHCLLDLIWRQRAKEFAAEIPVIISNHAALGDVAKQFGIDFYHLPVTKENKLEQESKQLELLQQYKIDLVVLAKYMQILSGNFISNFPQIINIHHSFLPAFAGANPYERAYERGVKIIGATAHYVTDELDAGPIIEQDVVRVSHRDTTSDLIRKGKDLERVVLARAVRLHLRNRVLVYGNRTVVFE